MGFSDWDGPVRVIPLGDGVTLVTHAYEEPAPSAGTLAEPAADPRVATGPHGNNLVEERCERCELPFRVCECCNICETTCADYCDHDGDDSDDD
jgi:hypothetical protein